MRERQRECERNYPNRIPKLSTKKSGGTVNNHSLSTPDSQLICRCNLVPRPITRMKFYLVYISQIVVSRAFQSLRFERIQLFSRVGEILSFIAIFLSYVSMLCGWLVLWMFERFWKNKSMPLRNPREMKEIFILSLRIWNCHFCQSNIGSPIRLNLNCTF